jgi:DNA polymerase-3 subunit epsilon
MREIVLDTETTGLDPKRGDRIVEIGCVELINHIPSGRIYHQYINPERDMPDDAYKVHGLSSKFLASHPVFSQAVDSFLEFISGDLLVIHNADFDMGFINSELSKLNLNELDIDRSLDTVRLARQKFPGAPANLDALCRRFNIDNSSRQLHGALLDAQILADVYLELIGGRQVDLGLAGASILSESLYDSNNSVIRQPRIHTASHEELVNHRVFLESLNDALWLKNNVS